MRYFLKSATLCLCALFLPSILSWHVVRAADDAPPPPEVGHFQEQSLSDEQKRPVVSILSNYDASSLTKADAEAINNAFRKAGIRQGPGQREAIEAAGFDPERTSALDPPPDRKGNNGKRSGPNRND